MVGTALALPALLAAIGLGGEGAVDPSWLDRLAEEDRSCLERGVGYAPPPLPAGLRWLNSEPLSWSELRGRVVVIQSWTSRTAAGRNWAARAAESIGDDPGVQLIALHTPQGADGAAAFLERRRIDVPVVIDAEGTLCDELGVYDRPVNIMIDRQGAVRYVGLTSQGLRGAIARLRDEPYDPGQSVPVRPGPATPPAASFPPPAGTVRYASDVRGRRAPAMRLGQWRWYKGGPRDGEGKVMVIDFWATWCGPCRRSIPHVNELADRFRDDVVIIGLSDERPDRFEGGLRKHRLSLDDLRYHVATDPGGRMTRAIRVRGIPHAIVMSSDGIVRWQGNPARLDAGTLGRIVAADRAATGETGPLACRRWRDAS